MNEKTEQNKTDALKTLVLGTNKYLEELKKKSPGKTQPNAWVSFEVFDQSMSVMTDNLTKIYDLLHELVMQRECLFEFRFGEINMCVSGSEEYREFYASQAKVLLDTLINGFLNQDRIRDIKKILEKKSDEQNKPYA